jgi:hypothetical protein
MSRKKIFCVEKNLVMPPLSKRKKQIKKLAEKKRNKLSEPLENSDFDDNNSGWEDEEIIWGDVEFDKKAETFVKVLSDGMKNYVPPTRNLFILEILFEQKKEKEHRLNSFWQKMVNQ